MYMIPLLSLHYTVLLFVKTFHHLAASFGQFTGRVPFLAADLQRQSTNDEICEGIYMNIKRLTLINVARQPANMVYPARNSTD